LSDPIFHQKNIELIIKLLLDNGYPLSLIFEKINNRLKTLIYNNRRKDFNFKQQQKKHSKNYSEDNKKIVVFPYIKDISERVASTIDKSKYTKGYRILNNLGKFIKAHKDPTELLTINNVVYKINCNDCNVSYVGQTKRQLSTRIKEHSNNYKSITAKPSVITQHMLEFSHTFDWNNTKILDSEANYYKRLVSEMLYIKEQANGINTQTDTELLDESYFGILDTLSKMQF